jgi:membrane protein implicated in regulation of membrane protease activity
MYFVLIALLGGLISIDILSYWESDNPFRILLKIFILSITIRYCIFFNFPSVMGSDAFSHIEMADLITLSGHLPPAEISGKYLFYPTIHTYISTFQVILNTSIKDSVFLSIGLISVIITIFLYLLGKYIAKSRQIGLLAVLLFNVTNVVIVRGITNIGPDGFNLCLFIVLLFIIFRTPRIKFYFLFFYLFLLVILFTHQLTTFVILLSLFLIFILELIINFSRLFDEKKSLISIISLTVFIIFMQFYWGMTELSPSDTRSFFDTMFIASINVLTHGGDYGADKLIVGAHYSQPFFETMLIQINYLILPFLCIFGILFWISSKDIKKIILAGTGAFLYIISYGVPIMGIRMLLTGRWIPIITAITILATAAGIINALLLIKIKYCKYIVFFIVVFIFAIMMITTPSINRDNPFVAKETNVRDQYTFEEIASANTITNITNGRIEVDNGYWSAIRFYGGGRTLDSRIKISNQIESFEESSYNKGSINIPDKFIVFRRSTLKEPVPITQSDLYGDTKNGPFSMKFFNQFSSKEFNKVYSSGGIYGYFAL